MARADDVAEFDTQNDGEGDDGSDDEALSWVGDEEQGRATPRLREPHPAPAEAEDVEPEAPGSRGRSVATAAFLVPYLAITVGWIFAVQQLSSGAESLFGEILWQFGEFLAILAAPLWLAATVTLTTHHRPLVRVGWLALGLGVLLPWPLVLQ
ncbi:MAG TPA: hypothetical protein VNS80_05480 [Pseudolysinimonas sp.]|nr:hypothetical protein [Pseudolysinimonas sp.]